MPNFRPSTAVEVDQDGTPVVPYAKKLNFIGATVVQNGDTADITVGGGQADGSLRIKSRQFSFNTAFGPVPFFILEPGFVVKEAWAIVDDAFDQPIGINVGAYEIGLSPFVTYNGPNLQTENMADINSYPTVMRGGQSFDAVNTDPIEYCAFNISNPMAVDNGTCYCYLYAADFLGFPIGPVLATSTVKNVADFPIAMTKTVFVFPTPFVPTIATKYTVVIAPRFDSPGKTINVQYTDSAAAPADRGTFCPVPGGVANWYPPSANNIGISGGSAYIFEAGLLSGGVGPVIDDEYFAKASAMDFTLQTRFDSNPNHPAASAAGQYVTTNFNPGNVALTQGTGRVFVSYYKQNLE